MITTRRLPQETLHMPDQVVLPHAYPYGFHDAERYVHKAPRGLSKRIVQQISSLKNEPAWMRALRLRSLDIFLAKPLPTWGADLSRLNFDEMYYYLKPTEQSVKSWAEVPDSIKRTFDRIGVPEAEKKFLAGVGAQYDSTSIYHNLKKDLEKQGVIFKDMDAGLREHEDIVREYFGRVVPPHDNKFAALNSAVWSGGSFIYVPRGVHVRIPLQAYFRINAKNMGQFERTLIIAEEGSSVHYVEGCFTEKTFVKTNPGEKNISQIKVGDRILTHAGRYQKVSRTQKRKYNGSLYKIRYYGDSTREIEVTEEHPFLCVRRNRANERNSHWISSWVQVKNLNERDYLLIPINQIVKDEDSQDFEIEIGDKSKRFHPLKKETISVPRTAELFRLIGYFLAEGSVDQRGYLRFSFSSREREFIEDVKALVKKIFSHEKFHEFTYKDRSGLELVFSSVVLARIFLQFGTSASTRKIPSWMMEEAPDKQKELIIGLFRGDGNYYRRKHKSGFKEVFRINTISEVLARQIRDILLRLGIFAFLNGRDRKKDGRKRMYTIGVTGEYMRKFGEIVGIKVRDTINAHKRATMFFLDSTYAYVPIKSIRKKTVEDLDVYNFSVKNDESYAVPVAVHNCSAPVYTSDSLHAAVVEIIVKKGAKVQYTTVQNWSGDVYNLVTKRMSINEEGTGIWTDANIGSKVSMKFPSCYLIGKGARGDMLSIALAGKGQHQDVGGKAFHLAPHTSSTIISKSISHSGGRASFRGLLKVREGAKGSRSHVRCDALILDRHSRSDTYPTIQIDEKNVTIGHEAVVSKVGEEQLFYLQSRGLTEQEAVAMIVNGFIEPIVRALPMEYAVEMNRLIELEMEGVG